MKALLDIEHIPHPCLVIDKHWNVTAMSPSTLEFGLWDAKPEVGLPILHAIPTPHSKAVKLWLNREAKDSLELEHVSLRFKVSCLSRNDDEIYLWFDTVTSKPSGEKKSCHDEQSGSDSELGRLRKDIERLEFAAQGANLGIWDFNPSTGKIIGNRIWATQKLLNPDELFADDALFSEIVNGIEKWSELVHPDDVEATTEKIQKHLDGETDIYHAEFRVKCGDGKWKWILDLGRVFERDADGVPVRMNGIHVDIDKQKRLQQRLSETKEKAEVANRAKSIFLANMSHELRTPLNAVLGYSQLLKADDSLQSTQQDYVEIISRSGEHLLSLINDVLDMSKIDAGHNVLESKWFDFSETVEEVLDLMEMKAKEKRLVLSSDFIGEMPHFALGDVVKLRQVLINLLGNAIKFTPSGEVKLMIKCETLAQEQHQIHFLVSDTGPGIRPEDHQRIFVPFEQLDSDVTQNGTGLGLSISKQFVEMMGGALTVSSQQGEGSTFTFSLAFETALQHQGLQPVAYQQVLGIKYPQTPPKILVAEDQIDNQNLIITILEGAGFQVKLAKNGQEAVELHHSWQPDLIWMDRRMPKMDGLEATKQIRCSSTKNDVKIVALTASVFNDEIEEMLAAGMDDFARKPFMPHTLFKVMQKHLDIEYEYAVPTEPALVVERDWVTVLSNLAIEGQLRSQILDAAEQGQQEELITLFDSPHWDNDVRSKLVQLASDYQYDELCDLFSE